MFTGLVETTGIILSRKIKGKEGILEISPATPLNNLKFGESIAINGTCLTLKKIPSHDNILIFNVLAESFNRTNLGSLKLGSKVNIERALAVGDRLGGHLVQGHVDGVGKVLNWKRIGRDWVLKISFPVELAPLFIGKGSITIDGTSLTIAELESNSLSVHIIPTTYEETCLSDRKAGSLINIETDVIGKYVHRFLSLNDKYTSNISLETLSNAGFDI